jgi:hypothetical protein
MRYCLVYWSIVLRFLSMEAKLPLTLSKSQLDMDL